MYRTKFVESENLRETQDEEGAEIVEAQNRYRVELHKIGKESNFLSRGNTEVERD